MITLTKEWLLTTIAEFEEERDSMPGVVNVDAAMSLAAMKLALASLEAEPVAYIRDGFRADGVHFCGGIITAEEHERTKPALSDRYNWKHQPLYTAPPAPVSVPEPIKRNDADGWWMYKGRRVGGGCAEWYNLALDDCRAAMLQGAEPVNNRDELPEGWVAVPVEPTEDMIVNGFESEPDESFSDEKEWEAYEAMSGCQQAAHRAKLCWAAMIGAAQKLRKQ
ncbi:hypothetical protein M8R96_01470 [Enterobacter hormaechei]|nr:hypothetical protein [Enterobacter hormaechei]MCM7584515.1 hypothetical protein [Enterobacter hormaechei]